MFHSSTTGDSAIRETDNDAAVARLSAVRKGYLDDPYVRYFIPRAHLLPPRPPLINIGTYIRTTVLDSLICKWLQLSGNAGKKCQIVSLGAGSDSRFWRLMTNPLNETLKIYIELDFPEVTTKKAMSIKKSKELMQSLGNVFLAQGGTALHAARYHLLPTDLRQDPSQSLEPILQYDSGMNDQTLLDPSLPTLLLFECVLAYMSLESSSRLLRWFVDHNQNSSLGCIIYEMFGLNDAFGRVMINNLKERGISLPGAEPYSSIESLQDRLLKIGFSAARALSLKDIKKAYVDSDELGRISTLEFLDETEELDLILAHYAISWGLRLPTSDSHKVWGSWGLTQTMNV